MIYIIFDLEATCDEKGKQDFKNEIIEIGAVKFDNNVKIDEFQSFVYPAETPVTEYCTNLTGISRSDVVNAPLFPEAYSSFIDWSCREVKKPLFCSWGFYDKKQIDYDCQRHKILSKEITRHISLKHEMPKVCDKGKLPSRGIGMKKALNLLDIPLEGRHHQALDDARNISKIFLYYYDKWSFVKG